MKRALRMPERFAVWALLTFAFCGCTRTSEVKAEQKIAVQEEVHEKGRERTSETVQVGPETITTTVEEYEEDAPGPGAGLQVSSSDTEGAIVHPSSETIPARAPRWTADHLVKRTVVVDQRGPSLATKTEVATQATQTTLHEKQESTSDTKKSTKWGLPWWLWALGAVGVALGIAVLRKTLLGKAVAAAEAAAKEVL